MSDDFMSENDRARAIIQDILINHLPRVKEGLERGYVDENQILVIYDHAVRARILSECAAEIDKHLPTIGDVQAVYRESRNL